jgi:DnaA family protein
MRQLPLPIGVDFEPTFERFVPGANAAALEHLRALAMPAAPVYLWGPAGSGKTHLLGALVHALRQTGAKAAAFDAQSLPPWTLGPPWSLAVIDQCEALDEPRQAAAFRLFVEAATHGVQIVAAGRVPPVDLPLREDLRTRLGWGHVFGLTPLADVDVRAALRREFDRRGVFLPDELMDYLLTRFARNLKDLTGLLNRLDHYALASKRAVTLPLLRQMLTEEGAA